MNGFEIAALLIAAAALVYVVGKAVDRIIVTLAMIGERKKEAEYRRQEERKREQQERDMERRKSIAEARYQELVRQRAKDQIVGG